MALLNESKEYAEAAKAWEGSMLFVVRAEGNMTPVDLFIWLDLWHGKCRGYKLVFGKEDVKADYVFEGPEKNWLKVLSGELDPIKGLMAGKFKLVGNMTSVMRHVKAAQLLVEGLQALEFDFIKTTNDVAKDGVLEFFDSKGRAIIRLDKLNKTIEYFA